MKKFFPWKKFLIALMLLMSAVGFSGCIYLVVGSIGAFGGYAISPDTVEGMLDKEYTDVWNAAVETVKVMGTIEEQNDQVGIINGKVDGAKVNITIVQFSTNTVQMRVKARKMFFPKISVAQDIFVKTVKRLKEGS